MTSIAVLAGGLATRIRPLTANLPKALIDINGHPFIDYQLQLLKQEGMTDVVLCVGYEGRQVEQWVGDGRRHGLSVRYSYDGPELMGTGGALLQALPLLSDPFLVLYGDSYLRTDYQAVLSCFQRMQGQRAPVPLGLMTVFENHGMFDQSNVAFEQGGIVAYDKRAASPWMHHIDWGLGIFSHAAFNGFHLQPRFDQAAVYMALVASGLLAGYEVFERFYEIGSFEGLRSFRKLGIRLN